MIKETKETKGTTAEKEMTGVCRFCYQTRIIKGSADMTEEEITEKATRACDCEAAKAYRIRMQRSERAKESVDDLFGERAGDFTQPNKVIEFMKCGIDVISRGSIKGMTVKLNQGLKCSIETVKDNKIKVSREAKTVEERKQ